MARKFTKEELDMIINDYSSGMKPYEIASKYNRNSSSIINKLKSLGIYENENTRFTKDDEKFLREVYPIGDWDAIFKRFPKSNKHSIIIKAHKLGIKADYYFWPEEDLKYLEDNYFKYSLDELVYYFNNKYTKDAIQTQAYKSFGYSTDDDWTDEENNLLIKYYPTMPIDDVCKIISTRSKNAIMNHATKLKLYSYFYNITYWNDHQNQLLLDNWNSLSDEELSELIGKPKESISERRRRLKLFRVDKDNLKYSDINKYFRGQIQDWKNRSMQNCNYQCILSGDKNFEIHHLYSFNQIISNFFKNNNYELKDFSKYTQQELNEMAQAFQIEHNKYPLGICIRKDIHDLYHKIYGKYNNTEEQWIKFKNDYNNDIYRNIA